MAARGRAKKPAAPKKKAGGYSMPPPIPLGEVIEDNIFKKVWRIGPSIGVGGFGEIYSAADLTNTAKKKGENYNFAIKVEPHENGPLFVEKNFYRKNANHNDIANFMKSKNLSTLGMPTFYGTGKHDCNGTSYRYLVMDKFGKDLWSIFRDSGKRFPSTTVFQLGLQMLDVLEYIHSRGYVHADIKGGNMLLGHKKGSENQAYLVDFGLASRIKEQEFAPNKKCAHDGTIEYTSRDAHLGEATMRGDLEILGYNMLHWLVGELQWEKDLKKPVVVQEKKEAFMKDVRKIITKQYTDVPDALIKFFEYINTLKPKEMPDFAKCQKLFESYLKSKGKTRNSKLDFKGSKTSREGVIGNNTDDTEQGEVNTPNGDTPKKRGRKPKAKPEDTDNENQVPDAQKPKKKVKRKSIEPAVVAKVKKAKLNPTSTPPAKENHANIATQTSTEKRRSMRLADISKHVSFKSPSSEKSDVDSVNSSVGMFEDSYEKDIKKKPKRKLISDEESSVKREVRRKVTIVKKGLKALADKNGERLASTELTAVTD